MALLNIVTTITREIQFVEEMKANIQRQFDIRAEQDGKLLASIGAELDILKVKLAGLIEAPADKGEAP